MRFRPRFSLRTLFVLVTIAGVCAGWVAYQLNWIRAREAALKSADPNFWTPEFNTGYPPAPLSLRIFGVRGVAGLRVVYIDKQPLLKEKLVELFPVTQRCGVRPRKDWGGRQADQTRLHLALRAPCEAAADASPGWDISGRTGG